MLDYGAKTKKDALRSYNLDVVQELTGVKDSALSRSKTGTINLSECHDIERASTRKSRNCFVCLRENKRETVGFLCRTCDVWLHIQVNSDQTCRRKWHKDNEA